MADATTATTTTTTPAAAMRPAPTGPAKSSANFDTLLLQRIESLAYLPTTVAVAVKFMQLGRDADADPDDYVRVISSDSALSGKLLSLSNSSWFGVRNKVTKPRMAVNLLGLGTVRMLALSYCLSGLHNELRLTPEESRRFWAASLCKAVAAKVYVQRTERKLAEEAFTAGLFEDLAMPIMYAVARDVYAAIVEDAGLNWQARLQAERRLFKLDHTEVGRMVAQKLELPEIFVDAIAFHHNAPQHSALVGSALLSEAVTVAALLPHSLTAGNCADAAELNAFLEQHKDRIGGVEPRAFLEDVQRDFQAMYAYFEEGAAPELHLVELMEAATREVADNTTRLVGTVNELLTQAASAGREVQNMINRQSRLEELAHRDSLTGALNRQGFMVRAGDAVANAARYRTRLGMLFLDLDRFKSLNDTLGHAQGDAALVAVAQAIQSTVRQADLVARLGGDEFVVLLVDCAAAMDAMRIAQRLIQRVAEASTEQIKPGTLTISCGLLWVDAGATVPVAQATALPGTPGPAGPMPLETLLTAADALMYEAKRSGGNQIRCGTLSSPSARAAS